MNNETELAGKSGTSHNNCDRYFIGYTPALIGGVWFGYDYPKDLTEFGGNLSVCIWDDVMKKIYEQGLFEGSERFKIPDSVGKMSYNKTNGDLDISGEGVSICGEGWFDLTRNTRNK